MLQFPDCKICDECYTTSAVNAFGFSAAPLGIKMSNTISITDWIRLVSALLVFIGLLFTAYQVRLVRQVNESNHDWNRRKAAIDIAVRLNEFIPGKYLIEKSLNFTTRTDPYSLSELEDKFSETEELRQAIHQSLNYFEYLAVGIKQGIFDEEVIKRMWWLTMKSNFQLLKPYIDYWRKNKHPFIWRFMEEYIDKWSVEHNTSENRRNTS